MQTIGERLEEARKRKGISIREASEATKIRSDYLQRFEGNTFEIGLPDIYVRGFLRTYAHYLKLGSEKLLTDYSSLGIGETRESRRHQEQREIIGRIDLPEVTRSEPPPPPPPASGESTQPRATAATRSTPTAVVTGAPSADRRRKAKIPLIAGAAILALVILGVSIRSMIGGGSTAGGDGITNTNSGHPDASDRYVIRLIAQGNVWVKVVEAADNRVLFEGDLVRGDTRTIRRTGKVTITYDAGKNLILEVQNQKFRMSADGQGRNSIPAPTS